MNLLQCSLIEKAGNDNGFEHVVSSSSTGVTLASARHPNRVTVNMHEGVYRLSFHATSSALLSELHRYFSAAANTDVFLAATEAELASVLRRSAVLSKALPNQAVNDFHSELSAALAEMPDGIVGTEVERMVRQRVGQHKFREAMMVYWGGACAVTGVAIPQVLRASHAKPWAECKNDAERLDVFNGFLLSANLDALFDRFLVSFDDKGRILISAALSDADRQKLGLTDDMALRWIDTSHLFYLSWHREKFAHQQVNPS